MEKLGVIGAGTMGIGLTIDLVLHGCEVVLVDITEKVLEKAQNEIKNGIRFAPLIKKTMAKPVQYKDCKIHYTTNMEDLAECLLIVENAFEKVATKEAIYRQLSGILRDEAFIGANTSCISITQIASYYKLPGHVVGMHFMNPVYLKRAVEVIKGYHTSALCIAAAEDMLASLEKKAIVVEDYPGFVSNRISHLFMNEAAFVVQDQVADAKQVDAIFKECYGHTMGPLETADLIGLDTVVDSLDILYESYGDSKYRCCPLLRKMVHAGLYGQKVGKGFYTY